LKPFVRLRAIGRANNPLDLDEVSVLRESTEKRGQCWQCPFSAAIDMCQIDYQSRASTLTLREKFSRPDFYDDGSTHKDEGIQFRGWQGQQLLR